MENIRKKAVSGLPWIKVLEITGLLAFSYFFCRSQIPEGAFVAAVSFAGYMISRNVKNVYLIIPTIAALLPYINKGYDVWVYIATAIISTIAFLVVRSVEMHLWQSATITVAIFVATMNIYRLITKTIYKLDAIELIKEGLIVFGLFFVLEIMFTTIRKKEVKYENRSGLIACSLLAIILLVINGMGLSLLGWAVVMIMALYTLELKDVGHALFLITAGGVILALMGDDQWGFMMTCIVAIAGASLLRQLGMVASTLAFVLIGIGLGYVESGVILGIDKYYIMFSSIIYLITYRRLGKLIKRFVFLDCIIDDKKDELLIKNIKRSIDEKTNQMKLLSDLYATYMDRRAALANQFDITRQIIDDMNCNIGAYKRDFEKYTLDIAVAQCAAAGEINGDCCGWQDIGKGCTAMVISDGMGKGKKAASESLMVTRTMLALLRAGALPETVLKMINTIMLMKEEDDFYATLDMVIINRNSGKTKFYKIGAAPTLIRRGDKVEEVKLSTVPLGIVNGLSIKYMETEIRKKDWIIMMSDGVSDGGDDNYRSYGGDERSFLKTIKDTAASVRSENTEAMSDIIINKAADSYIGRERDDLTVMVCRIN